MASSTTHLDTITSAQAQKEVTANALFDAASPASLFGRRAVTTTGLTWGYFGGMLMVNGTITAISNGTLALTASTTNYIEATSAGAVSRNGTGFTAGRIPLYTAVCDAAGVTSYTDHRMMDTPAWLTQYLSISVTTANVTLSAIQARANVLVITGAMTANRSLIVPNSGRWSIVNNNTGAYVLTVKTSAGTGVDVPAGGALEVIANGTNVIPVKDGAPFLNKALSDANTTLIASEWYSEYMTFTGTLTAQRDVVLPLHRRVYFVRNDTTGGFGLRFIGATGTGVVVPAGKKAVIVGDGTNIVLAVDINPSGDFAVTGTLSATGVISTTGASSGFAAGTGGTYGYFGNADTSSFMQVYGATGASPYDIRMIVNGSERATFTATGQTVTGLLDLSAASSGQIKFPATQNASADANTLDDYEEGTFTPALSFDTPGDLSVTYSVQVGRYEKIGRRVFFDLSVTATAFTYTTSAGLFRITGLPFTASSTANLFPCGSFMCGGGVASASHEMITPYANQGQTYLYLHGTDISGGTGGSLGTTEVASGSTKTIYASGSYDI